MSLVFFPSCKTVGAYPVQSEKLKKYLVDVHNVTVAGCCRLTRTTLTKDDVAISVCNNCAAILEESSRCGELTYVWQLINQDENFIFPDYHGEEITIVDCAKSKERIDVQLAVRDILKKMNFSVLELENNFANADFCGSLYEKCLHENEVLAPKRYVLNGDLVFNDYTPEMKLQKLKEYSSQITTKRAVTYCNQCTKGLKQGSADAHHLLELLFV